MLNLRLLADTSEGERVPRYDPHTGQKTLVNPATGLPEPWPLLGVVIQGTVPKEAVLSTALVRRGVAEGWIELDNGRPVHRPGGPLSDPWRKTHTFTHADAITIKCVDGDVRYRVVHQPDKYVDTREPVDYKGRPAMPLGPRLENDEKVTPELYDAGATRVDAFYGLELEEASRG